MKLFKMSKVKQGTDFHLPSQIPSWSENTHFEIYRSFQFSFVDFANQ